MAAALRLLGYDEVHHGLDAVFASPGDYEVFQRAADATFPTLPTYTGVPFTRAQWDAVFARCEAATDIASFFAPELIVAYPDARVVLVERAEDAWLRSAAVSVAMVLSPAARLWETYVEPALGSHSGPAALRFHAGWFRARTVDGAMANARARYREHNALVRRLVPPGRLLVFDLADGWAPLCAFLGRPVPAVPFPRVNESAQFDEVQRKVLMLHWAAFKRLYGRWVVAAAAAVVVGVAAASWQDVI